MRYTSSGIELQYKESQIARDAAIGLKKAKGRLYRLEENRMEWIAYIKAVPNSQELKQEDCNTLVNFITNMPQDYYEAITEYMEILVEKEKGIDILVPYIARNGVVLMTVNRHGDREPGEYGF